MAEAAKGVGRPKVGGGFSLVDGEGRGVTEGDFRGKYALVSWDLCAFFYSILFYLRRRELVGWLWDANLLFVM